MWDGMGRRREVSFDAFDDTRWVSPSRGSPEKKGLRLQEVIWAFGRTRFSRNPSESPLPNADLRLFY